MRFGVRGTLPDPDPVATQEWVDSILAVRNQIGEEEARRLAFIMINKGIEKAMPKIAAAAKKNVVDPDMPRTVVRGMNAIVDSSMGEIRDVLNESLTEQVLKRVPDDVAMTAPPPPCAQKCGLSAAPSWPHRRARA